MPLTDEELRAVLVRAEEIDRASRTGAEWKAEVAAVVSAAQEVGFSRRAVERALKEQLDLPTAPPEAGSLVWARSADDKYYVAKVISTSEDGAQVRFLRGSEHTVGPHELRPCAFIPGERVVVDWPMWGTWTCSVVSYDAESRTATVNDGWGEIRTFPISEIWLAPRKADASTTGKRTYTLLALGGVIGAVIGSIVTLVVR
jgi:hypothetical protein